MRSRPSLPALLLTLALALTLGACGGEKKGDSGTSGTPGVTSSIPGATGSAAETLESMTLPTAKTPDDLGKLVPEGTQLLAYVPDVANFMDEVHGAVAIFDEEIAANVDLDKMLAEIPFRALLETTKPMAAAVAFPQGANGPPAYTLILPVTDPAKVNAIGKENGMPEMPVSGSYVAVMPEGGEASPASATVPAIAKDIPTADVVLRADLASLRTTFADQIDEAFDRLGLNVPSAGRTGGMDMSSFMDSFRDFAKLLLDSAESLDLMLDVDDAVVNVHGTFTAKAGSKLDGALPGATDVTPALSRLPGGYPLAILCSGDVGPMPKWAEDLLMKMLEAQPDDLRELVKKLIVKQEDHTAYMGNIHAVVVDFGADGMRLISLNQVKDGAAYQKAMEDHYKDPDLTALAARYGVEIEALPPTKTAGADVRNWRVTLDVAKLMSVISPGKEMPPEASKTADEVLRKMFGPDGVVVHTAIVEGYAVKVVGGGDTLVAKAIEAARGGGTLKDDLADAVAQAGGSPNCLVYVDARGFAQGIFDLVRAIVPPDQSGQVPAIPNGDPVPLVIYGGAGGRYYMGGLSVDLLSIKSLVDDLQK